MRKRFAPIDDALIERVFQPVCDRLAAQIGISRTRIACLCIDAAALAWIVSRTQGLSEAVTRWESGLAVMSLAMLLLGLVALISLRTLFRRATDRKPANPLRLSMLPHRAVLLLMLASRLTQFHDLSDLADLLMLICATAALYLGACAERPPLRRRSTSHLPISGGI
jgi:hypothetical protein